ncbi:MAG: hypothetical protein AAFR66_15650, partial [Bacteroidota bacterium]
MKKLSFLILLISLSASFSQTPELIPPIGHSAGVISIDTSPDGKFILTGAEDRFPILWDRKGRVVKAYEGPQSKVSSVDFSPDGKKVLASTNSGKTYVWDLEGRLMVVLPGMYTDPVKSFSRFLPDGKRIAVGAGDKIRLYDLNGNSLAEFQSIKWAINDMAVSPDGNYLAVISSSGEVGMYTPYGEEVFRIQAHTYKRFIVSSIDFSPNGERLLTAGWGDSFFRLWDLNGQSIGSINAHEQGTSSAYFSHDGQKIISCGAGGMAKTWTINGELINSYDIDKGVFVDEVVFSHDDNSIIAHLSKVGVVNGI